MGRTPAAHRRTGFGQEGGRNGPAGSALHGFGQEAADQQGEQPHRSASADRDGRNRMSGSANGPAIVGTDAAPRIKRHQCPARFGRPGLNRRPLESEPTRLRPGRTTTSGRTRTRNGRLRPHRSPRARTGCWISSLFQWPCQAPSQGAPVATRRGQPGKSEESPSSPRLLELQRGAPRRTERRATGASASSSSAAAESGHFGARLRRDLPHPDSFGRLVGGPQT